MAKKDNIGDGSTITEHNWFSISLSLVLIGCVLGLFVASWIISPNNIEDAKRRLDLVVPLATLYLALITFCTVAWRGLVGARQADQQKAQNDANDDANYAKLLQEGAKLLGDSAKPHDQLAGLTTLEIVIHEPKKRFSSQALDMVANFYASRHRKVSAEEARSYGSDVVANYARLAINKASQAGMRSSLKATFVSDTASMFWQNVSGFQHQRYEGGTIRKDELDLIAQDNFSLKNVVVTKASFPFPSGHFDRCIFKYCDVKTIDEFVVVFDRHRFQNCNFSGCHFDSSPLDLDEDLKFRENDNWYDVDDPPVYDGAFDWSRILIAKRRISEGTFAALQGDDIPF